MATALISLAPSRARPSVQVRQGAEVEKLQGRLRSYIERHPEISPQELLIRAVEKELQIREQEDRRDSSGRRHDHSRPSQASSWAADAAHLHEELTQRLLALTPEPPSLWQRARRFLLG